MTFQQLINAIVNNFNNFLSLIGESVNQIISNNFVKLVIYIGLFSVVIYILYFILKLIFSLFENQRTNLYWENLEYDNYKQRNRRYKMNRRTHE